jgi:hypothetical protein
MYQVIEQTDEEKLAMYMKLKKEELAKMLLAANKIVDNIYSSFDPPFYMPRGDTSGCYWLQGGIKQ